MSSHLHGHFSPRLHAERKRNRTRPRLQARHKAHGTAAWRLYRALSREGGGIKTERERARARIRALLAASVAPSRHDLAFVLIPNICPKVYQTPPRRVKGEAIVSRADDFPMAALVRADAAKKSRLLETRQVLLDRLPRNAQRHRKPRLRQVRAFLQH